MLVRRTSTHPAARPGSCAGLGPPCSAAVVPHPGAHPVFRPVIQLALDPSGGPAATTAAPPGTRPALRPTAHPALPPDFRLLPPLIAAVRTLAPIAVALLAAACTAAPPPHPLPAAGEPPHQVVVLVPGITGTRLRDTETGRLVWGDGASVVRPHDGGYAMALPIDAPEQGDGRLEPAGVIDEVRLLGVFHKRVYEPIRELVSGAGYRPGDLDRPRPGESYFELGYDWRLESAVTARRLLAALERVAAVRGASPLRVALVCQSSGAHVCRWLAKYGGATLEEAEAGRGGLPAGIEVSRLVLVGNANGGSVRILRELDRGRRYLPLVGRTISQEAAFTFRSVYQELPVYRDDVLVGAAGEPLAADVWDAGTWQRYAWSVFRPEVRRRLAAAGRADLFGDQPARLAYLARRLDRGRRYADLLARDAPGFCTPRVYLIQNGSDPTPDRGLLVERGDRWRLLFTGDRRVDRDPVLHELISAAGDGHATRASQLWLSPQELAALAADPVAVHGGHFELILAPEAKRRLLDFLADDESPRRPAGQEPASDLSTATKAD